MIEINFLSHRRAKDFMPDKTPRQATAFISKLQKYAAFCQEDDEVCYSEVNSLTSYSSSFSESRFVSPRKKSSTFTRMPTLTERKSEWRVEMLKLLEVERLMVSYVSQLAQIRRETASFNLITTFSITKNNNIEKTRSRFDGQNLTFDL